MVRSQRTIGSNHSDASFCMRAASTQGRDSKLRSLECLHRLIRVETQLDDLQGRRRQQTSEIVTIKHQLRIDLPQVE